MLAIQKNANPLSTTKHFLKANSDGISQFYLPAEKFTLSDMPCAETLRNNGLNFLEWFKSVDQGTHDGDRNQGHVSVKVDTGYVNLHRPHGETLLTAKAVETPDGFTIDRVCIFVESSEQFWEHLEFKENSGRGLSVQGVELHKDKKGNLTGFRYDGEERTLVLGCSGISDSELPGEIGKIYENLLSR